MSTRPVTPDPNAHRDIKNRATHVSSTPEGAAIVDRAFVYDDFETTGGIWLMDADHRRVLFNLVQTSVLVANKLNLMVPFILLPPSIAEPSLALWLLFKGVDLAARRMAKQEC